MVGRECRPGMGGGNMTATAFPNPFPKNNDLYRHNEIKPARSLLQGLLMSKFMAIP